MTALYFLMIPYVESLESDAEAKEEQRRARGMPVQSSVTLGRARISMQCVFGLLMWCSGEEMSPEDAESTDNCE